MVIGLVQWLFVFVLGFASHGSMDLIAIVKVLLACQARLSPDSADLLD